MAKITLRPFSIGPDFTFRAHVGKDESFGSTWQRAVKNWANSIGLEAFNFVEETEIENKKFTLGTGKTFWVYVEELD